jgi:pimeloyl-ACP methyl ester carboxylesterase
MPDPTRPLPLPTPLEHGGWAVYSYMTPEAFTVRGLALIPSNKVIPVVVVPGVMGTNLRAKHKPNLGRKEDERNEILKPGEAAWRPPNGKREGIIAAKVWKGRRPEQRQKIFDAPTLEVDDSGPIILPSSHLDYILTDEELRGRWWGEVHAGSYGALLLALEEHLNQPFGFDDDKQQRFVRPQWKKVMACDSRRWGLRDFEPLTEAYLGKQAKYSFPVYACGYNWLESCAVSSQRLEQRILDIIGFWKRMNRQCEKVIIVTHSMGGLVARACALRIPDKIAGVIHGVMPALGAPAAYRRMACGTERSSPSNDELQNVEAALTAQILGDTTDRTTPVLAVSPGALELLPNHLYPEPWLHVRVKQALGPAFAPSYEAKGDGVRFRESDYDYLHLPNEQRPDVYKLYRDMTPWYRLINPALADPAGKYRKQRQGSVEGAIRNAINKAEQFHRTLGDYYHPNTYAFYGDDNGKKSFGQVRWVARLGSGSGTALTASNVMAAQYLGHTEDGRRLVLVDGKTELHFEPEPQDTRGDGTVPHQSGAGPSGNVKQVFATNGYDHQGSYNCPDMVLLTLRLAVKIVQEAMP